MAPEVMLARPYNEKADIFSLACCITEVSAVVRAVQKLKRMQRACWPRVHQRSAGSSRIKKRACILVCKYLYVCC